jgi:hypothetical protein
MEQKMRFGLVGNTEKKMRADYEQVLRVVSSCFQGQFFFFNQPFSKNERTLGNFQKILAMQENNSRF